LKDIATSRLVFLHGAGGTRRVWRYQTSAFLGSVAIDLPGHPTGNGMNTVLGYAEFVAEMVVERKLSPAVLVGHSMGGAIAIEIALGHPEMLEGIVLVGSGARLRVTPLIRDQLSGDYRHAVEIIAELAHSPKSDPRLKRASIQELLEVPPTVTYGDFEACNHFDRMNEIERISIPTLIICGEDDRLTPVKYSAYMRDRIRNARLVIIPDAGHSVMLEKPEDVNAAIRSFISELSN